ncbi:hypothetical protein OG689_44535 [Kitasatospora sp. NBC_00240]|uniref:hypothetical protein n=1 Tax=Kitasatospora sp. NBC_00240 TaxID=2903567 RepID=UPI0022596256|nr:hypothetical protein [Kitasatospora sp. NBC_00240]MCX5216207.1 hypothetical protein [Kitasatospora sp. NBC_00240]
MGTNSKSSHESYAVSPTVTAEVPPAPIDLGPSAVPGEILADWELDLLKTAVPEPAADLQETEAAQEEGGLPLLEGEHQAEASEGGGAGGDLSAPLPESEAAAMPVSGSEEDGPPGGAAADDVLSETASGAEPNEDDGVASAAAGDLGGGVADVEEPEEPEVPEETDPPLTPIPDAPPAGVATGTPVLVGGEDFLDSQATLVSYNSPAGPREVLLAHVSEEAEAKLLDALSVSGTKMIDIEVEEAVHERLELDKKAQLAELVTSATTSVQHKLKNSLPISEASIQKHQKATEAVTAVLNSPDLTDDEKAMAQHYMGQLQQVGDKIENGGTPLPWMEPYQQTVTKLVTKQIPAPSEDPEPGTLAAQLRDASRIKASMNPDTGETSWNGTSRSKANGKEYAIDLGEGWSAVYRPYAGNDPSSTEFSMRGQLEVHAPVGAGNGKELVERLEQLHLVNKPMTAAEGEWTYLSNNITAQGLGSAAGMKAAFAEAKGLEDLQVQEIIHQRAESLIGLGEDELHQQVKRIQLEAAQTVLPKKVSVLREAVAKATGFDSGNALASSAGYDPTPAASGGWLTWSRFDVTGKSAEIKEAYKGKSLTHGIGKGDMVKLFGTGVLASTEKRAVMGIGGGLGMSEQQDKYTGGANSVFLRVSGTQAHHGGGMLVWDDPSVLMRRSDYYAYDGDHYGAINPAKSGMSGLTRNPMKIANFSASSNEVMFRDGIDLLGAEAPSRIVCNYAHERAALLESFKTRGITHLGGKAVEDVVQHAY